jgi:hypothetical protein
MLETIMKNLRVIILCIIIGLTFSLGCKDAGEITAIDGINKNVDNSPAVANVQNSFSISVTAKTFNSALEYPITIDKFSLALALSIENLTAGDVSIQVFNDTKQMLYKADFTQKVSLAQTITLEEKPTKVKFIFNNLTATFNCALTAK